MGPSSLPAEPEPVVFVTPQLAANKAAAVADSAVASLVVVNIYLSLFQRSTTCLTRLELFKWDRTRECAQESLDCLLSRHFGSAPARWPPTPWASFAPPVLAVKGPF